MNQTGAQIQWLTEAQGRILAGELVGITNDAANRVDDVPPPVFTPKEAS